MRRGDVAAGDDAPSLLPELAAVAEQLATGLSISSTSPLRFFQNPTTRSLVERLLRSAAAAASPCRAGADGGRDSAALTAAETLAMTSPLLLRLQPALRVRGSVARCRG